MMKLFLLLVLLAACEGQSTTKHKGIPAGSSCFLNQAINEEIKSLRGQLLRTNNKMQAMQKAHQDNSKLESMLQIVNDKFTTVDSKLEDMDDKVTTVDNKVEDLDERVDSKLYDVDTDLGEVKVQLGQVKQEKEAGEASAFLAAGVRHGYGDNTYQKGDRLVYLDIRVNPRGHYNKTTGEYKCQKSGVYYFTYSIYGYQIEDGYSHSRASARLMKDSVAQGEVYFSNDNTEPIYISLSQSLLLQCDAGEKVWVEGRWNFNSIRGTPELNVFAGFLLFMN